MSTYGLTNWLALVKKIQEVEKLKWNEAKTEASKRLKTGIYKISVPQPVVTVLPAHPPPIPPVLPPAPILPSVLPPAPIPPFVLPPAPIPPSLPPPMPPALPPPLPPVPGISLPTNIDLYLSNNTEMTGGDPDPDAIIRNINNKTNKFLKSKDGKFVFNFNDSNKKKLDNSIYLGKGALTAVFGLDTVKVLPLGYNLIPTNDLILRITDKSEDLKKYISKWKEDRTLLPDNIPEIYLYGQIYLNTRIIGNYAIVKKYMDINSIEKLNVTNKKKLLQLLLILLNELQSKGYVYRDLKSNNIGYEADANGNVNKFIVLDHDEVTILSLDDPFFSDEELPTGCRWYCAGTLPPYYLINDYNKKNSDWKPKLNKMSVIGLIEIICKLFYNGSPFYIHYINPGPFIGSNGNGPYRGIKEFYDDDLNYIKMIKELNAAPLLRNTLTLAQDTIMKKEILELLYKQDYCNIPTYAQILSNYNKIM